MYGSVRIEFGRQKSQNSISTGLPIWRSMRSDFTFTQRRCVRNGGAGIVSAGARVNAARLPARYARRRQNSAFPNSNTRFDVRQLPMACAVEVDRLIQL